VNLTSDEIDGLDLVWIGVDKAARVAAFVTAGSGYVPSTALDGIANVEMLVLEQPTTSECRLSIDVPKPDSYVALVERGYYVFDWAHPGERDSFYDLAARPTTPIDIAELPLELRYIAERTRISSVLFADCELLEVASLG
jgi:hypothetical protein